MALSSRYKISPTELMVPREIRINSALEEWSFKRIINCWKKIYRRYFLCQKHNSWIMISHVWSKMRICPRHLQQCNSQSFHCLTTRLLLFHSTTAKALERKKANGEWMKKRKSAGATTTSDWLQWDVEKETERNATTTQRQKIRNSIVAIKDQRPWHVEEKIS